MYSVPLPWCTKVAYWVRYAVSVSLQSNGCTTGVMVWRASCCVSGDHMAFTLTTGKRSCFGRIWWRWSIAPYVDEAHCCDTSRSLQFLIGQHSKATSSEQGCKPALVKQLLYRSDMSTQLPTELTCLTHISSYSRLHTEYWILTHWERTNWAQNEATQSDQTSLYYTYITEASQKPQTPKYKLVTNTYSPGTLEPPGCHVTQCSCFDRTW